MPHLLRNPLQIFLRIFPFFPMFSPRVCTAGAVPDLDRVCRYAHLRCIGHGRVELLRAEIGFPILEDAAFLGGGGGDRPFHLGLSWIHQRDRHPAHPAFCKMAS